MKTLVLACPEVIVNVGGFTVVALLPCPDDTSVVPPPNPVYGSVPGVTLVLEQYAAILINK